MSFTDVVLALIRRWYLTLAMLLVAALAAVGVYQKIGPSYTATATVMLVPPATSVQRSVAAGQGAANPLLFLGGLDAAKDAVIGAMGSQEVAESLQRQYPGATFTAATNPTTSGPVIVLSAAAKDQATTAKVLAAVTTATQTQLDGLQNQLSVTQENRVSTITLTRDQEPTASHKAQIQMAGFAGAGVLVLFIIIIAAVDFLMRRRGTRNNQLRPSERGRSSATLETVEAVDEAGDAPRTVPTPDSAGQTLANQA